MAKYNVQIAGDESPIVVEADGFKTAENGSLIFYVSDENGKNSTVFVAGPTRWDYFEPYS